MAAPVRGFTLVELMVTVAILAVLLGFAIPGFNGIIARNRLVAVANEVVGALQLGRMEAMRRNRPAILCPSTNGTTCNGTNWGRFIVFVDGNGDGAPGNAADILMRDVVVGGRGLSLRGSSNVATNNRLRFASDGFATIGNANARTGGISVCSDVMPTAENTRDVMVAVSRVSVASRDGGSDCAQRQD